MRLDPETLGKIEQMIADRRPLGTERPPVRSALGALSEKDFQRAVVAEAKRRGWLVYHTHDSRRSEPGFPDLVLVRGDRLMFAELKAAAGRPSAAQLTWIESLQAAGATCWLWRPDDWPQIVELLA